MWLGARIRFAFFTLRFECGAGGSDFYVEAVVADEGDHFAIGVEAEFTEHSLGGEAVGVAEFGEDELGGFVGGSHSILKRARGGR